MVDKPESQIETRPTLESLSRSNGKVSYMAANLSASIKQVYVFNNDFYTFPSNSCLTTSPFKEPEISLVDPYLPFEMTRALIRP